MKLRFLHFFVRFRALATTFPLNLAPFAPHSRHFFSFLAAVTIKIAIFVPSRIEFGIIFDKIYYEKTFSF